MTDILPPWPLFTAFLVASFVLAVTPGPGVFYVVTRSVAQGRRAGLASVAGVALGNLGNAIGASIGLAALFAVSSAAFTIVKYLGALYLVWLGVQTLRAPAGAATDATIVPASLRRVFVDGFVVALFNPKTTIFFAAFLPQFVREPGTPGQTLALGAIFVAMAAATDSVYAACAGAARPWLLRTTGVARLGRALTASAFIGLGLLTAFTSRPRH